MKVYSYRAEEITQIINEGIDVYLTTMNEKKIISKEELHLMEQYKVVATPKDFFGKLLKHLWKGEREDELHYKVVRIIK